MARLDRKLALQIGRGALAAVLVLFALPQAALAAAFEPVPAHQVPRSEVLHYEWHLGGLLGTLAGLFLPSSGDGVMSVEPAGDGMLSTELLITSPDSEAGEHWRYGSKIASDSGYALEAWNDYQWRDKNNEEREVIEQPRVRDVVSGIYQIRRELPERPRTMQIWSDGKIYPVVVIPRGEERRRVDGRKIDTLHYSVRGYESSSGRRWKGSLELWLARDAAATPVEMHIERSLANLRLELHEPHEPPAAVR
jgi:hypothetical protein